ncbi:MAG: hypothetical protein ACI9YB_001626 [Halioglobus sp.]
MPLYLNMSYNLIHPSCNPFHPGSYFDQALPFPYGDEDKAWNAAGESGDYSLFDANVTLLTHDRSFPVILKVRKLFAQFQAYRSLSLLRGDLMKANEYCQSIKGLWLSVKETECGFGFSHNLNSVEAYYSGNLDWYFRNLGANLYVNRFNSNEYVLKRKLDTTFSPFPFCSSGDRSSLIEALPFPYLDENKAWKEAISDGCYESFEQNVQAFMADPSHSKIIKLRKTLLQYQSYCTLATSRGDDEKSQEYFLLAGDKQIKLVNLIASFRMANELNRLEASESSFMEELAVILTNRFTGFDLNSKREQVLEIYSNAPVTQQRVLLELMGIPSSKKEKTCSFGGTVLHPIPSREDSEYST